MTIRTRIPERVFQTDVVLVKGKRKEVHKALSERGCNISDILSPTDQDWGIGPCVLFLDRQDEGKEPIVIIYFPYKPTLGDVVHECTHVAKCIVDARGIDSEETLACVTSWVAREVLQIIYPELKPCL